jgi:hypothetical protein
MPHFAHQRNSFQPAKTFFDVFPLLLADDIAALSRGEAINGAAASSPKVLRHVRRHPRFRHSRTKSAVSKPLSPPTVTHPLPGSSCSISIRGLNLNPTVDYRGETLLSFLWIQRVATPSARAFHNDRRLAAPASALVAAGELHRAISAGNSVIFGKRSGVQNGSKIEVN